MGTHIFLLLVFSAVFVLNQGIQWDPIIHLPYGKIRGHVLNSTKNRPYYAFQDVPFAKPPIGELRFKEPQPPESWQGVKNATENQKKCVEFMEGVRVDAPEESEDCLYTNVYTPQLPNNSSKDLLPVFFVIYGGKFVSGNGDINFVSPGYFMNYDLIIVVPSYRLGPLGFLYEDNDVFEGNLGLKDINYALKWTNKNIAQFGGDPKKVTIGGISSGGTAAAFQLLHSKSAGLFRGAILQSGTTLCGWAFQRNYKEISRKFASLINPNIPSDITSEKLLSILQNTTIEELKKASANLFPMVTLEEIIRTTWAPVIESKNSNNPLVTESALFSMKNGNFIKVPIMVGFVTEEFGYYFNNENILEEMSEKMDNDTKYVVSDIVDLPDDTERSLGAELKQVYTNKTFVEDTAATVKFLSAKFFKNPTIRHADLQSKYTNVYLFKLSHKGPMGYHNRTISITGINNVAHSEDETFMYGKKALDKLKYPPSDGLIHERFIRMWSNFITQLEPTPREDPLLQGIKWPKYTQNDPKYLNFNRTLSIDNDFEDYKKWEAIMEKYNV